MTHALTSLSTKPGQGHSMKQSKYTYQTRLLRGGCFLAVAFVIISTALAMGAPSSTSVRERLSLNSDWRFIKGDPQSNTVSLLYDVRPQGRGPRGGFEGFGAAPEVASPATNAVATNAVASTPPMVIKQWVLPTGNDFIKEDPSRKFVRPEGNLGGDVSYVQPDFDDSSWRQLNLPHDWGIEGPFMTNGDANTGRLPYYGVGWYRKKLAIPAEDAHKSIFLDVDGAMSYSTVWLNGQFVGGWPYGYSSWRVDLTPYIKTGETNQLAIRLDNPPNSSRWYPGGGIYRNVWLVKTSPVHVAHWGTYVTTPAISAEAASVNIQAMVDNETAADSAVTVKNEIFELTAKGDEGKSVASLACDGVKIAARQSQMNDGQITIKNPKLWSIEKPQRYVVVTSIEQDGKLLDSYETPFGIRTVKFDADKGFFLNGEHVRINGVCDHADLGPLGSAINVRALERQVQLLKEMGCNAIRTSHNMPAPELLDLCDRLGMLVMDESFDCWAARKRPGDYHLLFPDWHEQDIRAEVRRDRNHPSVFMYSVGNEIGEQGSERGNQILAELIKIVREEDSTRVTVTANNKAGFSGFSPNEYVFGFNYEPQRRLRYAPYHERNPLVSILSSESASCISSRGIYLFPFDDNKSGGGMPDHQMSSYDLYAPPWANAPDVEFAEQDRYPYLGGEFVWTGFDYLGEPTNNGRRGTPDSSRSSYFGILDLSGFKKDRFYIYQAHWRPELPMAHILPHWNWPERVGQVTPVHVYTSGDSAELFLNGRSLGLKKKGQFEYRLRWDNVVYQPGELKVVAYKNGKKWATDVMKTTGPAAKLLLEPDRNKIEADGKDLSYVTVTVADKSRLLVPRSMNHIKFSIEGPGEIVATDNGDPTSMESFQSPERNAFNGLALVIVRAKEGQSGTIKLTARSNGLEETVVRIKSQSVD